MEYPIQSKGILMECPMEYPMGSHAISYEIIWNHMDVLVEYPLEYPMEYIMGSYEYHGKSNGIS